MSDNTPTYPVRVKIPPATPISNEELERRAKEFAPAINASRFDERMQAAVDAFSNAIGTAVIQGSIGPEDSNFAIRGQFNERLAELGHAGSSVTIHRAAIQAVREIAAEHHIKNEPALEHRFEEAYHGILKAKKMADIPHRY